MTNSFSEEKPEFQSLPHSYAESSDASTSSPSRLIRSDWCDRPSTQLAPALLGCTLHRQLPDGPLIQATIVETEAYAPNDPACHAYRGPNNRNASMFGPPGYSYVYLIYGMYHCLNVVSESAGTGSAVLIRALELDTIPPHLTPKQIAKPHRIAAGPGKLCRALLIDRELDGISYHPENGLWLEHRTKAIPSHQIVQTTRIGITKAIEKPWRWYLKNSQSVSKLT
ncbi:DNA-3-methyladenine glycosylase subfamily [Synechococcus sp. PCC 7335]|uniref:DNA-3-methyladenine glycosylase n=1 Tax=Synechococcus sp. (strain ATCC 29403 / PCC 7335) TaxID=91464 RepID=UPI00017EC757|nr:DNA-3-methyladenine glycosylase [Synechococcus sp. PCC 7335]EDX87138.1 DNA-3-methyladenine glycosylase subfamily [Synechococcus sp. PCC 7335]